MQTIVALLLVAVASVSASSLFLREKRSSGSGSGSGSGSSPLSSVPILGQMIGNAAGGSGGVLGAGVGATGHNEQAAECTNGMCAPTACTSQSSTNNNANGEGGLIGIGSGVGPVGANLPICPAVCAQCNQVAAGTVGK